MMIRNLTLLLALCCASVQAQEVPSIELKDLGT